MINKELEEILPRLIHYYRRGELVPFIGAGMSVRYCTGWQDFVEGLEEAAQPGHPENIRSLIAQREAERKQSASALLKRSKDGVLTEEDLTKALPTYQPSSSDIIRRADLAVSIIRAEGHSKLVEVVRKCLVKDANAELPKQTEALSKIYWPLIISTNYDDLLAAACTKAPRILGRSPGDCQFVLQSLELNTSPILWAVQGYLGGQHPNQKVIDFDATLNEQIVVGHAQYQKVINLQPHFRRAFAEVYRRRVFLFMGSGLEEDYFLNLFSEISLLYGPGHSPSFALMNKCSEAHKSFLLRHLNVKVIDCSHSELPEFLNKFEKRIGSTKESEEKRLFQIAGAASKQEYLLNSNSDATVSISFMPMPNDCEEGAIAVSIGKEKYTGKDTGKDKAKPKHGSQSFSVLKALQLEQDDWNLLKDSSTSSLFQHEKEPRLFGTAARNFEKDTRDLRAIPTAMKQLIDTCLEKGFSELHCGLISAGDKTGQHHPVHSYIQMLRGAKTYFKQGWQKGKATDKETKEKADKATGKAFSIIVHIVDPDLQHLLMSGKVKTDELILCDDAKVFVEVKKPEARPETFVMVVDYSMKVSELARVLGITNGFEAWQICITPSPEKADKDGALVPLKDELDKSCEQIGVIPGTRLSFTTINKSK